MRDTDEPRYDICFILFKGERVERQIFLCEIIDGRISKITDTHVSMVLIDDKGINSYKDYTRAAFIAELQDILESLPIQRVVVIMEGHEEKVTI